MTKLILFLLGSATISWANPKVFEGTWNKSKNIQPMVQIKYVYPYSTQELNDLKAQKYICQKIQGKQLCKKLVTKNFEIPEDAQDRLYDSAPVNVHFEKSKGQYYLINDSDSIQEWQVGQDSELGQVDYTTTTWRALKDGPVKVILSSHQHNQKSEFLVLENNKLGKVIATRIEHSASKGWTEFWGIVEYLD